MAHWSTNVGRGAIRFYLPLNVELPNEFFSQAVVVAKDVPGRERLRARLEEELAEKVPSAISRVSLLELGPPVGWPVQYRVSGPDPHEVRAIAQRLAQMLGGNSQLEAHQFRLDRTGTHDTRSHRSGSGAPPGPEFSGIGHCPQHRGVRNGRDAGAR